MSSHQRAVRSGMITRACLDNGMSEADACETAAVVLPLLDAMLIKAWDDARAALPGAPNPYVMESQS